MRDTESEAETQAEGEAGSMQEPDSGLNPRTQDHTWAKGRCSIAEPPRHPTDVMS